MPWNFYNSFGEGIILGNQVVIQPSTYQKFGLEPYLINNALLGIRPGTALINSYDTSYRFLNQMATEVAPLGASRWQHIYVLHDPPVDPGDSVNVAKIVVSEEAPAGGTISNYGIGHFYVNQSGWDGTSGQGLNATSVIVDNTFNPAWISQVLPGSIICFYRDDMGYREYRTRGSGGALSTNLAPFAYVTAVDAGNMTLTLEGNHQIGVHDGDSIEMYGPGDFRHAFFTTQLEWARWIGAVRTDASGYFLPQFHNRAAVEVIGLGSPIIITSTSWVPVHTNLNLNLFSVGGAVETGCTLSATYSGVTGGAVYLTVAIDGVLKGGTYGYAGASFNGPTMVMTFSKIFEGLPPGDHTIQLYAKIFTAGSNVKLYGDVLPINFWAKEIL